MSELRPAKKKRSLEDHALMPALPPPNSCSPVLLGGAVVGTHQHWQILHLEQQVASLLAELDHERAGRALDAKRHRHAVERAEAQAALGIREAETARELLRETTEQSEQRVQRLTLDRDQALHQNRQLRLQLEEHLENAENLDEEAQEHWQRENERLRNLLNKQAANEEALRQQVTEWKEQTARQLEQLKNMPKEDTPIKALLEEAPPTILKELTKTRLSLADAERHNRQLERDRNELQQRNRNLVRESEKYKQHAQRLIAVEKEWLQNQAQYETAKAEQAAWGEFMQQLHRVIPSLNSKSSSDSTCRPPEVATVIRFLETHKRESAMAQQSAVQLKQECEQLRKELSANSKTRSAISEESSSQQQKREWEIRLANVQQQLQTAQQQASLYQREADSLRTLIQTFETQMIHSNKDTTATAGPVQQALELQLKTAQKQLNVLQAKCDDLCTKLETSQSEHIASQQELESVKEKFCKLRDALMAEKQKVTTAEERANAAEELAGKGAFNPDRTRVLHLTETPLVQALKEEVAVLKRQLAERRSIPGSSDAGIGTSVSLAPNPDKLNQRLKENFKEQIALFREGVYLMTGFKVDMIPTADPGRPTFRLRSVYAEQEEDHLLLQWPKDQDKSKVTALDILNTDFAKKLTKTPAYEYMTKFHSLPAFLASCQLNLFENQTIM